MDDLKLENLVPVSTINVLKKAGLHKFASSMLGVEDLTLNDIASAIGKRAMLRRHDMSKVASGLLSLARLNGEAVDPAVWRPLMDKAMFPAGK